MKNKLKNKAASFFIFFFSIPFVYEIIKFPTSENIICSSLSWFMSAVTIRYLFWKNKEGITVYNAFPLSSVSLLFFSSSYFISTLTCGMIYSKPLTYNIKNGILPFLFPSLVYLFLLLIHFSYRKILFFSRIKNLLTRLWKYLGLFYLPSLKEIFILSTLGFLIHINMRVSIGTNGTQDSLMSYTILFFNLMCIPCVIIKNSHYNKVYSKKKLALLLFFFFALTLMTTVYTSQRALAVTFIIITVTCLSFNFKFSSLFLKKHFFRNVSYLAFLLILLSSVNNFLGAVGKNRYENKGKGLAEKVQSNIERKEIIERDPDGIEEYITLNSGLLNRMIFNKVLDNDLYFFNKIPSHLRNHVRQEVRNALVTAVIPTLFFGSRSNKKDVVTTYGSVLDAFRYYSTGEGTGNHLEGSKPLQDFILFNPYIFLLLYCIIMPLTYCFLDSFVFLEKNHQVVSAIIALPILCINAFSLSKNSIVVILRSLPMAVLPCALTAVLFLSFVRFFLRFLGSTNQNKGHLNQD